jgi:hypothetical protein
MSCTHNADNDTRQAISSKTDAFDMPFPFQSAAEM